MKSGRIFVVGLFLLAICGGGALAVRADGSRAFSLKSLHGTYAGEFSGTVLSNNTALLIGGTGIFIADGKGAIAGHESYTFNGTPCNATVSGTYSVQADGSGTNSITFSTTDLGCEGGSYTQSFAIGDSGRTVVLANSNQGQVINEVWHAQK